MFTFNLDAAFADYCVMLGIDRSQMTEAEIMTHKRAFMAGCGFMFKAFGRTVDFDLETADELIKNMEEQLADFYKDEIKKINNIEVIIEK